MSVDTETLLWSKVGGSHKHREYNDNIVYEDDDIIIIEYYGQKSGGRDHLIQNNAKMVILDKENKRKYVGDVCHCLNIGSKNVMGKNKIYNINLYKLIIMKKEPITVRVKKDLCDKLGLSGMNSFERTHGITLHSKLDSLTINTI
jgi:hypothetical protein